MGVYYSNSYDSCKTFSINTNENYVNTIVGNMVNTTFYNRVTSFDLTKFVTKSEHRLVIVGIVM